MEFTDQQLAIIESPFDSSTFLDGPAGAGKTTSAVERLVNLIRSGIPGRSILLFTPQRNLGSRYQKALSDFSFRGLSLPVNATYGGLARRTLSLFWPVIQDNFHRFDPSLPPTFLTLESSLYFLSKIVEPLIIEQGYFSTVTIQRNRLYSQILDNLNKSSVHSFSHKEIADRLIAAWLGDPSQETIYYQAQEAANLFRDYCYQHNLLDYSLQIEIFTRSVKQAPLVSDFLKGQFDHLIYDNCEEDIPVAHDFIRELIPGLSSALVVFDRDAGYRNFLGASPSSAISLKDSCSSSKSFESIHTSSRSLRYFNNLLTGVITKKPDSNPPPPVDFSSAISLNYQPSHPEMISWVADKITHLIDSGASPDQIVVLAPYLSDSLSFLLLKALDERGVPATTHRPSRALRDEPVTQALLTLACLAHPSWKIHPSIHELAQAFVHSIKDLDLTRAFLLSRQAIKHNASSHVPLADFDKFSPELQDRISFYFGSLYQELLDWLNAYAAGPPLPLDHFFAHIFGEVLSRSGYGFQADLSRGRTAAQIIDSSKKFRQSAGKILDLETLPAGKEYYHMVKTGVLANQYLKSWTELPDGYLLIAPAYTFLLSNKAVDYQFWLDVGSRGWYERIYQPLTNPHVLHRNWTSGRQWDDGQEQAQNLATLSCFTTGLIRRCRETVFACLTETDERGYEQKGLLLLALNNTLSHLRPPLSSGSGEGIDHA